MCVLRGVYYVVCGCAVALCVCNVCNVLCVLRTVYRVLRTVHCAARLTTLFADCHSASRMRETSSAAAVGLTRITVGLFCFVNSSKAEGYLGIVCLMGVGPASGASSAASGSIRVTLGAVGWTREDEKKSQ